MKKFLTYLFLLLALSFDSYCQRINFKPFVQDETINVQIVQNPMGLNFNAKQRIIVVNDPTPVSILLSDIEAVVIEIEAPIDYDLTLEFLLPEYLSFGGLDTGVTVPLSIRLAYNNTGEMDDASRRISAIEVPAMFKVITLPVQRRQIGGPPLPPPTPDHQGYTRPRGKVFIYLYGVLSGAPQNARAGNYSSEVILNVNYADNSF